MIVENKAGAAGAIAAEQVKSAPPDGYTLMWTNSTTMVQNKVLFKKLPYDPDKDFVLISWMNTGHLPTILNKDVPAKNLAEFADYARSRKVSMATYGAGSYAHVVVESAQPPLRAQDGGRALSRRGADVAGRGVRRGPGRQRQLRLRVERAAVGQRPADRGADHGAHAEAARCGDLLRAGSAPSRRSRCAAGSAAWAPAGMPEEIVQKLSDLMVEGGKTERIQKIIDTFGIDEGARDRAYFKKVLDEEGPVWIDVIKSLNIEPQ